MIAVKAAGCLPPCGVGGWIGFVTRRFEFVRTLLKFWLATGASAVVKSIVFRLRAWAIWSGFSHQYCPTPASSCAPAGRRDVGRRTGVMSPEPENGPNFRYLLLQKRSRISAAAR